MTGKVYEKIRDGFSKIFNNAGTISQPKEGGLSVEGTIWQKNLHPVLWEAHMNFFGSRDFQEVAQELVDAGKGLLKKDGSVIVFKKPRKVTP